MKFAKTFALHLTLVILFQKTKCQNYLTLDKDEDFKSSGFEEEKDDGRDEIPNSDRVVEESDFEENGNDFALELVKREATNAFRQRALELHNEYRARHGSPPLVLDDKLNREAQAYAQKEARTNVQKHSCGPCDKYGENLAYKASTRPQVKGVTAAEWACNAWYDEVSLYNFARPNLGMRSKWGHFSALVWKSTKKMGIGVSYGTKISRRGNKMNTVYVVARYFPPGNVWSIDVMRKNVQPFSRG